MPDQQDRQQVHTSSTILIAVAWLVVIIPAGWGLTYTVQNALKLFSSNPPPAAAPASPAATAPAH